jgi:hypothetical protein
MPPSLCAVQALKGWEVKAGYVGSIRASIPLTSGATASSNNLSAAGASSSTTSSANAASTAAAAAAGEHADVCLHEVYITVAPVPPGRVPPAGAAPSPAAPAPTTLDPDPAGAAGLDGWEQLSATSLAGLPSDPLQFVQDMGLGLGQAGVMEGIRRIAGGLENMLQRLSAVATSVTIRVEVPTTAAAAAAAAAGGAGVTSNATPGTAAAAAAAGCGAGGDAAGGVELVLNVSRLSYNDATPNQPAPALSPMAVAFSQTGTATAAAAAATELVKHLQVHGVTLEVLPWCPEEVPQQHTPASPGAAGGGAAGGLLQRPAAASSCMSDMRASIMLDAAAAAAAQQQLAAAGAATAPAAGGSNPAGPDPLVQGVVLGAPNGEGLGASMELKLTWLDAAHTIPQITAELALTPVKVQLQPWQLPLLQLLPGALSGPSSSSSRGKPGGVGVGRTSSSSHPGGPQHSSTAMGGPLVEEDLLPPDVPAAAAAGGGEDWGRRSLVQDLFFPQCRGFVADSLLYDAAGGTGSTWGGRSGYWSSSTAAGTGAPESVYEDARSFMTGIASSMLAGGSSSSRAGGGGGFFSGVVNTMSNTLGGWAGYAQGLGLSAASSSGNATGSAAAAGGGAGMAGGAESAAVQQPPDAWSVRVSLPELTAVLWYHDPASASPGARSRLHSSSCSRPDYVVPPRLVLECGGLVASADLQGSAVQADFKAYQLEVSEHLPGSFSARHGDPHGTIPTSSNSSSSEGCACCGSASSCWGAAPSARSPAEYAQVPRHLPAAEQGCRPVPLYGQAATSRCPDPAAGAGGVEGVVVWPLLCWGGRPLETRSVPSITRPCINIQVRMTSRF